ncbi:ADP-ribosyltransferase [Nannocystis pusilla]|uniref:ADP-ribosyltransferase n=1 Tax=Nannocystis pusilla TaxID=889268 RepID=UPI003DA64E95
MLRYTGNDYGRVNTALRDHDPDPKWGGYERTVNAALAKLPKFKSPVVRGCDLPSAIDPQWQKGEVVSDPGFVSTAAASDSPTDFRKQHEIYIESKTGVYIEDLSYFGHHKFDPGRPEVPPGIDFDRESEVLFPSNTKFRVVHREKMKVLEWESADSKELQAVLRDVIYLVEV